MTKLITTMATVAALAAASAGCAEPVATEPATSPEKPSASTVFSRVDKDEPLPVDQVFVPDAHIEDGALYFRVQMLPGYYLYKDKIGVRSLSDTLELDGPEFIEKWSRVEIVVDDWFGEQEVFFDEAHGSAQARQTTNVVRTVDIELVYQGCKKDGICYVPQAKVLSVDVPAQLESATGKTE